MSSSGHLILLGSRDKTFEVFLHAGSAAALLVALRDEVGEVAVSLSPARIARIGLTLTPAAAAGLLLEGPVEPHLGRGSVAVAQVIGGAALLLADRSPGVRGHGDATAREALLVGLAQACALVPGVSRNGATLTAARLLGFRRDAASRMSRHAALPVIAGATALKLARLRVRPPDRALLPAYAAGAAAAFASTIAAARLVPRIDRVHSYAPFGLYRIAVGLAAAAFRASGRA